MRSVTQTFFNAPRLTTFSCTTVLRLSLHQSRRSMASSFQDYFGQAKYKEFRPSYPDEVFSTVLDFHGGGFRELAIDLGCGSGQATLPLAKHFKKVIGFDPSKGQIDQITEKAENVEFRVGPAEKIDLPGGTVDLITVAQAAHWFDLEVFWKESARLLHPGGTLALWSYGFNTLDNNEAVQKVCKELQELIDQYWPSSRQHVAAGYRTIVPASPPFKVTRKDSSMGVEMSIDAFLGYANTWSALREFNKANPGKDIFPEYRRKLVEAVGEGTPLKVSWPLHFVLCKRE